MYGSRTSIIFPLFIQNIVMVSSVTFCAKTSLANRTSSPTSSVIVYTSHNHRYCYLVNVSVQFSDFKVTHRESIDRSLLTSESSRPKHKIADIASLYSFGDVIVIIFEFFE